MSSAATCSPLSKSKAITLPAAEHELAVGAGEAVRSVLEVDRRRVPGLEVEPHEEAIAGRGTSSVGAWTGDPRSVVSHRHVRRSPRRVHVDLRDHLERRGVEDGQCHPAVAVAGGGPRRDEHLAIDHRQIRRFPAYGNEVHLDRPSGVESGEEGLL